MILARWCEALRPAVWERAARDLGRHAVGRIKPASGHRTAQAGHIYGQRAAGRHIDDEKLSIGRCGCGCIGAPADPRRPGSVIPESSDDDLMALVGDQSLSGQGQKEVLPDGELLYAEGVDICLPARIEAPGVMIPVKYTRAPAQHGPVFLAPEDQGGAIVWRLSDVL